jgi:hypothetical protein
LVEGIVLRKVRTSEELALDMLSTPDFILKSVDWGTIKGTHRTYRYVNQDGVTISETAFETRPVTIEGWIVAENENHMTSLKRKLNGFVNPKDAIDLFYDNYTIRFVPDETVKYPVVNSENNEIFCKFQISGTCPNPLFSEANEKMLTFVNTTPSFHFPLMIPNGPEEKGVILGKRIASLMLNIVNNGDVSVGMKITLKANASVTKPSIINVNTQESFVLNKTMTSGEEVEIVTTIGKKSIKGKLNEGEFSNYFMYKELGSVWLQLNVGDNLFAYSAEDGINNLDVYIHFSNQFLEVQGCY